MNEAAHKMLDKWAVGLSLACLIAWCAWDGFQLRQARRDAVTQEARIANRLSELRSLVQDQACRCVPEGDVELEDGKMGAGGRIIPETKETIARVQELLEKFDRLLEDVKSGAIGVEIDGSLWKGHAEAKLKRNP